MGLQVGHWQSEALPAELTRLHGSVGGYFEQYHELDVNLDVARRAGKLLRDAGVAIDLLPAEVPEAYRADAFLSVHADTNLRQRWRGYKLACSAFSQNPAAADALVQALDTEYVRATGLARDVHPTGITPDMLEYYGFNFKQFRHAVHPQTPAAIIEMGFISDAADRQVLYGAPDKAADGIARGLLAFLRQRR